MDIQKLADWPGDGRPETGPMQFGNDWPGVFIRGDNAMYYARAVRAILLRHEGGAWMLEGAILNGLAGVLEASDVRLHAETK